LKISELDDGVITKPWDALDLVNEVRALLEQSR
jgi:hypothetical protein